MSPRIQPSIATIKITQIFYTIYFKKTKDSKNNCELIVQKYLTPRIQLSIATIKITQIFNIIYLKNISLNV